MVPTECGEVACCFRFHCAIESGGSGPDGEAPGSPLALHRHSARPLCLLDEGGLLPDDGQGQRGLQPRGVRPPWDTPGGVATPPPPRPGGSKAGLPSNSTAGVGVGWRVGRSPTCHQRNGDTSFGTRLVEASGGLAVAHHPDDGGQQKADGARARRGHKLEIRSCIVWLCECE